jgi:hypothetical protein
LDDTNPTHQFLHRLSTAITHPHISTQWTTSPLLKLNEPAARSRVVPLLLSPDARLENPPAKVVVTGRGQTQDIVGAPGGILLAAW